MSDEVRSTGEIEAAYSDFGGKTRERKDAESGNGFGSE